MRPLYGTQGGERDVRLRRGRLGRHLRPFQESRLEFLGKMLDEALTMRSPASGGGRLGLGCAGFLWRRLLRHQVNSRGTYPAAQEGPTASASRMSSRWRLGWGLDFPRDRLAGLTATAMGTVTDWARGRALPPGRRTRSPANRALSLNRRSARTMARGTPMSTGKATRCCCSDTAARRPGRSAAGSSRP
jgi:hypothetical protein